jgi:ABC-2 type transport system ATP-binding protein
MQKTGIEQRDIGMSRTPSLKKAGGNGQMPDPTIVNELCAEALSKTYRNGVCAVNDVSLFARPGEVVGVVGPNGAGKSTTLKILATLLRATSGEAHIAGISVKDKARVRLLLGVALQEAGLDPLMTGHEHFEIQASLYGLTKAERWRSVRDLLIDRFDLGPYIARVVGTWSLGTQRRLATALALLHEPSVVLLDEPTAGLDPRSRRYVWESIDSLRNDKKAVLFSSQYLEEADALCDRVYVIDRGSVVASGTPAELKALVGGKRLTLHVELLAIEALDVIYRTTAITGESRDGVLIFPVREGMDTVANIIRVCAEKGLGIIDMAVSSPSLDDVFLKVTGNVPDPEPAVRPRMDFTTRRVRGGGARWK